MAGDSATPESHTVETHFQGKSPQVREIYDSILVAARQFGPVEEDPKKTSIHLNRTSAFAGVETRKEYLLLNIKTNYAIESPRAVQTEQVSSRRHHTKVKLAAPEEVDGEIERWLRDGYDISG